MTNKSLSDSDIRNYLKGKVKVMRYASLKKIYDLDKLLSKFPFLIILYEYKPSYGHWCAILKLKNGKIEFFDPYGTKPDMELKRFPMTLRNEYGMDFPYVASLLYHSKADIEYNPHRLQKMSDNIRTCGQWCCVRCKMNHLNIKDFYLLFKNSPNKDKDIVDLYNSL